MKIPLKNRFKFRIKDTYLENILPRFHEERIRAFLTLASTLLAISVFGFFAISPTLTTIAQLKKQLSDSQFVDQKLTEKIANLSSLQQSYAQLQDSLPLIMNSIPASVQMPQFTAQIQSIAQTANFQLGKMQTLPVEITPDAPVSGYNSFGFVIDGSGTNKSIINFISLIQSFDRIVSIDGLSILKSTDKPNTFQLNIRGKAYFKKA